MCFRNHLEIGGFLLCLYDQNDNVMSGNMILVMKYTNTLRKDVEIITISVFKFQ